MQFRDLGRQYEALKEEIDEQIFNVISSSAFISGTQVQELEERLSAYVGVKHCISCANGTDALSLALMAWNIGEGDAVFVPDFTFFASGEVVSFQKATPIFVDVDKDTYNIDTKDLEKKIEAVISEGKLQPKVIIAVDLFGQPADYEEICKLAQQYGLKILEDAAQGFGGMIGAQMACNFGDIATTSFFPAKPLGCYGDGGAIFTNHDEWAAMIRSLRIHGKGQNKYDNVRIGMNSRLDTVQAAILLPKFRAFVEYERDWINKAAERYTELLKDIVITPVIKEDYLSSWAQYTIQLPTSEIRDGLQVYLKENGIPSMVYYPKPMHKQLAFQNVMGQERRYPVTEKLCETVLSLPIHPYITEEEQICVVQTIKQYFNKGL